VFVNSKFTLCLEKNRLFPPPLSQEREFVLLPVIFCHYGALQNYISLKVSFDDCSNFHTKFGRNLAYLVL
jgi:hypothetical protein